MARSCGCPAATTVRSTFCPQRTVRCSRRSRSATSRTACACGRSRAATHLGTPALLVDVVGVVVVVALTVVVVVGATVVVVVVTSVVLVGDDDVVVDVVCAGVVRTGHGVDVVGSVAFVDEVATAVESTLTVVVGLSGLRRASGCAAIVPAGGSPVSSVSSGAVWLALVGCG